MNAKMSQIFLSIQAQDFIEDGWYGCRQIESGEFLSIQAQDFIEDGRYERTRHLALIPEHSSSELH